jgi:hypothetical protein
MLEDMVRAAGGRTGAELEPDQITASLAALSRGDPAALERLLPVV